MIKWAFILLLFVWPNVVYGEGYVGLSTFSILSPKFPCSRVLKAYPKNMDKPAIAILYGTFGNDWSCVRRFIKKYETKKHLVEIHFSNEACRRNHRCLKGEFFRKQGVQRYAKTLGRANGRAQVKKRTKEVLSNIERYKTAYTKIILSTGLEDNFNDNAYENIYDSLKRVWYYEMARSPIRETNNYPEYIERHGMFPNCNKDTIYNNDGTEIPMSLFNLYRTNCFASFYWLPKLQGINGGRFIKPYSRNYKIRSRDIIAFRRLP